MGTQQLKIREQQKPSGINFLYDGSIKRKCGRMSGHYLTTVNGNEADI